MDATTEAAGGPARPPADPLPRALAAYLRHSRSVAHGLERWWEQLPVQEAYRVLADEFAAGLADADRPPEGKGKGVVTAGGGAKYFPSLWVQVNLLRKVGCKLPVEVWYLGRYEFDPAMERLLAPLGCTFRDASEACREYPARILNGWELKPYAVLHSRFREVLFLDADCTPLRDPAFLFRCAPYKKHGAVFWPDFYHWTLRPETWDLFGLPRPPGADCDRHRHDYEFFGQPFRPAEFEPAVESGQLVVDRARCWRELRLTKHFCDHSEYWFRHVHGDKETFHLAWRKMGTDYAMPATFPDWDTHTAIQHDFAGKPLFEHRNWPEAKWKLDRNVPCELHKCRNESEGFRLCAELKARWSGRPWDNPAPSLAEASLAASLAGKLLLYHRVGHDRRLLEFLPGGRVGSGSADLERRWSVMCDAAGEGHLALGGDRGPTCVLRRDRAGVWCGEWVVGERMPVRLMVIDEENEREAGRIAAAAAGGHHAGVRPGGVPVPADPARGLPRAG